ncbi:hypothetical protein NFI96_033411 [Prochilodus magdalenae]|nr:hypothetical protein NFI96_033411 [Prochilodus magdalenae]
MEGHLPRFTPIFVLLAFSAFILLICNITSLERLNCQTISAFYQIQSSIYSAFKAPENLLSVELNHTYCAHLGQEPTAEEAREEIYLLNSISWPGPLIPGLPLQFSSDSAQSYFVIRGPAEQQVGGQLVVDVHMLNFLGQPKKHGGDFLVARLHSPELGASVVGQVHDHQNGNYTVLFPLLWEGLVKVEVTMVHPSEAVVVLKRLREEQPDRVFFKSVFRSGSLSETTECNLCLPNTEQPLCNYTDPHTGEPWYCYKPKKLGCDTRINHSKGGYKKNLLTEYEAQFFQSDVNIKVPIHSSGMDNVTVLPAENGATQMESNKFIPSGYYYHNSWRPLGGTVMLQFNDSSAITECLKGKIVHMFGDSTVRQWFEYLNAFVPELKQFNLYTPKGVGPYMAVDSGHNILVTYRCHGPPIRFTSVFSSQMHYIPNELNRIRGGPNVVVLVSIWSHFSTFPVDVYIRRLRHIRRAVVQLLNREPATLVVIRSPNLQKLDPEVSLFNSDWFSQQQDMVLRAMFREVNVRILDAWEMSLAHHLPHLLHPPLTIIKNMVDLILSQACPVSKRLKRSPAEDVLPVSAEESNLSKELMVQFYTETIESVITTSITATTKHDTHIRSAEKTTGVKLPTLPDLHTPSTICKMKLDCQTSVLHQNQNSIYSTFKTPETLLSVEVNHTDCAYSVQEPTAEEAREESYLFDSISWPGPLKPGLPFQFSSDPARSYFVIRGPAVQHVGGQLVVNVHMLNFLGEPKGHGGDFLVARLHSPELKAGVAGQVHDHQDGNYTVLFPLLWEGVVYVEVTMTTECNLCLPNMKKPFCNYTDPQTGEPWYCYKPKTLGCDTRISHATGGYKRNILTKYETKFFQSRVNIKVPIHSSGMDNVTVLPAENGTTKMESNNFIPSGYYYNDSWRSLGGTVMLQFNSASDVKECLKGKIVHMLGDSTLRQWFEYLTDFVPDLKQINLYTPKKVGPYMAVDSAHNILVTYRCHGPPIRFSPVYSPELHYIANELDGIRGGPNVVVLVSIWAHFSTFPVGAYIRRLRHIRKAVVRLLNREPATLVVIRSPSLQNLDPWLSLLNSDWFSQQLDTVLRAMFREVNVRILDAWEMTLAHRLPHLLHPLPTIIKNMVDLILSQACPVKEKTDK